jgi:hypothetical protein
LFSLVNAGSAGRYWRVSGTDGYELLAEAPEAPEFHVVHDLQA